MATTQVISPYTADQLRMAKPQLEDAWLYRDGEWSRFTAAVHRLHPGAAVTDLATWCAVFGNPPNVPHPASPDPRLAELAKRRKLAALGEAPTDPEDIDFWLFRVAQAQILENRVPEPEGDPGSPERQAWAARQVRADMLAARELRDQWEFQTAADKARELEDPRQVEAALERARGLEADLRRAREEHAARNGEHRGVDVQAEAPAEAAA